MDKLNESKNTDNQQILEKEIDLVQSCINRMAQNSFIVKGWLVSLITVVLVLLPENFDIRGLCIIGFFITLCFWYLDAFFLKMENLYKLKYEWIIKNRLGSNMYCYDLNPYNQNMWIKVNESLNCEPNIVNMMKGKTMIPLYLPIFLLNVLFFLNSIFNWF